MRAGQQSEIGPVEERVGERAEDEWRRPSRMRTSVKRSRRPPPSSRLRAVEGRNADLSRSPQQRHRGRSGIGRRCTKTGPPCRGARIGSALPVLDLAVDPQIECSPRLSPASLAKKSQSLRWPRAHTITLMLDPPPRTLPIDIGMARPFRCGLGCGNEPQSVALPRLPGHCRWRHDVAHLVAAASFDQQHLDGAFSARRRARPSPSCRRRRR